MPMEFEERLERAIQRGKRAQDARARADAERAMTEAELRRLHTQFRLELSEHIENCLRKLAHHLPGFRFESVASERGWGAAVSRDDVNLGPDRGRGSHFSRFELVIPPLAGSRVLELTAKGAVRNREVINRTHYEKLADVDIDSFTSLIDRWILEYAELYAAGR
jgi:hypothetical protein